MDVTYLISSLWNILTDLWSVAVPVVGVVVIVVYLFKKRPSGTQNSDLTFNRIQEYKYNQYVQQQEQLEKARLEYENAIAEYDNAVGAEEEREADRRMIEAQVRYENLKDYINRTPIPKREEKEPMIPVGYGYSRDKYGNYYKGGIPCIPPVMMLDDKVRERGKRK